MMECGFLIRILLVLNSGKLREQARTLIETNYHQQRWSNEISMLYRIYETFEQFSNLLIA